MLNKATKLMDQRNNMIKEAYQVLNVLGVDVAQQVINQITINKGKIVKVEVTNDELVEELQMQLDIAKEELDYYHDVEKDYNNDIKLFQEENAKLIDENMVLENEITFKDGQILGLNNRIKQLEEEIEALKAQIITTKVEEVIGVKAPEIIIDEPEELTYDENDEVLQNLYVKLKQGQMTLEKCKPTLKAKVQKSIELLEKQIAERIEELKNNKDTLTMEVADTMHHDVQGEITINDKTYLYKATNNHYMPIVYGAMSQDVLDKAKEMINKRVRTMNIPFNFAPQVTEFDEVVYDFKRQIVVWKTTEGQYKGYTNEYIFAWDGKSAVPMRKLFKNALNDKRTLYKPMNGANGSKKQKEEGQRILSLIDDIFGGETNEIVVNTNENVNNNTNEEDVSDALFGVDDME